MLDKQQHADFDFTTEILRVREFKYNFRKNDSLYDIPIEPVSKEMSHIATKHNLSVL